MHTAHFQNGALTIEYDGRVIIDQPFDPYTQQPWADEETAQAWATDQINALQGNTTQSV